MSDNSLPPERRGAPGGDDPRGATTWHGSDEPAAPWERGGSAGGHQAAPEFTDSQYPPLPQTQSPKRRQRRRTGLVAALAVLVVALAAGTALFSGGLNAGQNSTMQTGQQPQRIASAPGPVQQASGTTPDWTATAEAVAPSVVSITVNAYQGAAQGSGVILDSSGHVITNHHVVADAASGRGEIAVTLNDKRTFVATIVGSDPSTDLAVLKMEQAPDGLRPITLGDSSDLKVGVPVMAIGNPLGLSGTVTTGIVSALDRPLITRGNGGRGGGGDTAINDDIVTNAIQTSAAINPGNSGGALVNASGQLIGINSSIAQTTQDGGNIGIGFAIPVNAAKNIADQLMQNGRVRHAFLGVSTRTGNVPEGSAQRAAAIVADVTPGAPAAAAGIRRGDAIVALDNDAIDGSASLVAQVRDRQVDQQVTITVVRNGQRSDLQVTLGGRPEDG